MIAPTALTAALLLGASSPDDAVTLSASLDAAELAVGDEYEIRLTYDLADGFSATESGMRSTMLQIDPPDSAELTDEVSPNAAREFVMEPWEREIQPGEHTITFALHEKPGDGATIGLNVIAYITEEGSDEHHFIRRRLEVPLQPNAHAVEVDATNTSWGEHDTLHVGDEADDFTLPEFGGTEISLSDYFGEKNVIVTTYRAHW